MRRPLLPALLLVAAAPAAAPASWEPGSDEPTLLAQLMMRQRTVIRVRRMRVAPVPVEWQESKGPKCVPAAALAGAVVNARDRVDLVFRGGQRVRARLDDDCRGLDFYSGFYLRPDTRGLVCAGRDAVRSRSGARCEIERFRSLEAIVRR